MSGTRSRYIGALILMMLALTLSGCDKRDDGTAGASTSGRATADNSSASDSHPQFPDRPTMRTLVPGVEFCEIRVSGIPLGDNQRFVAVMKGAGKKITFKQVKSGDHYDSMIEQGIPAGIDFMMFQGARPAKPASAAAH